MSEDALEMVDCERRKLRLSGSACLRFWQSANPDAPPVWEGRHACHQCPAGAIRCGKKVDPAQAIRTRFKPICPRCLKTSDRIINDRLCVSCYNRDLQVQCGRNRKGQRPVHVAARLFPCQVTIVQDGFVEWFNRERAAGPVELAVLRARRAKTSFAFGWAPLAFESPLSEKAAA